MRFAAIARSYLNKTENLDSTDSQKAREGLTAIIEALKKQQPDIRNQAYIDHLFALGMSQHYLVESLFNGDMKAATPYLVRAFEPSGGRTRFAYNDLTKIDVDVLLAVVGKDLPLSEHNVRLKVVILQTFWRLQSDKALKFLQNYRLSMPGELRKYDRADARYEYLSRFDRELGEAIARMKLTTR